MANIETVTADYGGKIGVAKRKYLNIYAPVGPNMANRVDDVMVIQAMLNLIVSESSTKAFSGGTTKTIPPVNGMFTPQTAAAILNFQRFWEFGVLKVDGIVHPGSYRNRVIKVAGRDMTITGLNKWAEDASDIKYGFGSYPETLPKLFPQLWAYLTIDAVFSNKTGFPNA
jgi:hypothetical protein